MQVLGTGAARHSQHHPPVHQWRHLLSPVDGLGFDWAWLGNHEPSKEYLVMNVVWSCSSTSAFVSSSALPGAGGDLHRRSTEKAIDIRDGFGIGATTAMAARSRVREQRPRARNGHIARRQRRRLSSRG